MEKSNASRNGIGHFFRVLHPLVWWLILVLVLYGIRTNERLLERTRLDFSVSLQGHPVNAVATLDGTRALSGQKISLGRHTFAVTYPNAEPFSTNLVIWYGPHNLGNIKLKRSMGTLHVQATPPASTITISGPEFSTNLYDSSGITLTVPTDQYTVRAEYPHWSRTQNSTVLANTTASCVFAPRLGALNITCNKGGATYRLESADGQTADSGSLPTTVAGLPVGSYSVTALYHSRRLHASADVETGVTNAMPFQFILGAARFETVPPGADVRTAAGSYLGQTPLLASALTPRRAQFNLSLAGYEPVSVSLNITADQTNWFSTNLVSINYVSSLQAARADLASSNYEAAVEAAGAALHARANDAVALALQKEASKRLQGEQERQEQLNRPHKLFDSICSQDPDASLFKAHELTIDKPAKAVAAAVVKSLQAAPMGYEILNESSPESQTYQVSARHTFSLGILGGSQQDCLMVIGQAEPSQTQIFYELLQYQIQDTLVNFHTVKRLVPLNPSRIHMNGILQTALREGEQDMAKRIQTGIAQAQ